MTDEPVELFVYGTSRGADSTARPARLPGVSPDVSGPYPTIVPGGDGVAGELFSVGAEVLARLDRYEGNNPDRPEASLYLRRETVDGMLVYVANPASPSYSDVEVTDRGLQRALASTEVGIDRPSADIRNRTAPVHGSSHVTIIAIARRQARVSWYRDPRKGFPCGACTFVRNGKR